MRTRRLLLLALVAIAVGLVGCLGDADPSEAPTGEGNDTGEASMPGFVAPVQLDGSAFEPSIALGPEGTIYVTAPSSADNTARMASWLWLSRDGGQTWTTPAEHPVDPPPDAETSMEGDLAVDPRGWLYQLDTYYEDNTLGAWSDQGRVLEHERSAQGTPTRDDRPWIEAVGDGELVYLGNHIASCGPADVYRTPRQWVYKSLDAGQTWTPIQRVPVDAGGDGFAAIDADASGRVAVAQRTDEEIRLMLSEDGATTFTGLRSVAEAEGRFGPQSFPSVAVDGDAVYVAWTERTGVDNLGPVRLSVARSTDGGESWDLASIGDGERAFVFPWLAVGPSGQLGLSVYAADAPIEREEPWSIVAGVEPDPTAKSFVPGLSPADAEPVARTQNPEEGLRDFHQNAFGPDERLHIAYMVHQEREPWIRWTATTP